MPKEDENRIRLLLRRFFDAANGTSSFLISADPDRKKTAAEHIRGWANQASGHTAADAEQRSKSATITYRRAWGANLRRRFKISSDKKLVATIAIIGAGFFVASTIYAFLAAITDSNSLVLEIFTWVMLSITSVFMMAATFLLPDDRMFLDRLSFILPYRNFLMSPEKILWSNIEEIALVDLRTQSDNIKNSGPQADFVFGSELALRLIEASGEEHDIVLNGLEKEELPNLVDYIRTYAPHARGLAQLEDLERFHDYQSRRLEGVSYTQLWESCAALQFGLTSFTPLIPGAILQDRFKVERQIAAGGFSAVYLTTDDEGKKYVLKESVVPSNLDEAMRSKAQEQFEREAKLLSRINHSQIASVYDHFQEQGRSYLRIEYIEGQNLRRYINENKTQSERTVHRWCEQLAGILIYLHELSPPIVHRDLSPDNIVVRPDGRLVLIDFGAANEFIGAATGTLVGKHAYMAPEQIRGNAEPVSDVYSLGACAFYCLTARDPEPIRTSSPLAAQACVTDWFDGFVKKCTSLERDERLPTARECLEYLQSPQAKQESSKIATSQDNS